MNTLILCLLQTRRGFRPRGHFSLKIDKIIILSNKESYGNSVVVENYTEQMIYV